VGMPVAAVATGNRLGAQDGGSLPLGRFDSDFPHMKRKKPLSRAAPLRRGRGLKRGKPMKKVNAKRGGHMFPKNVSHERRAFIRLLPCVLRYRGYYSNGRVRRHDCRGRVQACHLKSRGSGGPDVGNMWPGCAAAHEEQHRIGVPAFEARWHVSLAYECARREAQFARWAAFGVSVGETGTA
jgi:hypothetical protein